MPPISETSARGRLVLAMILSGTIGLAVVESGLPPLTVVFFRCLIGGAAMALWLTWRRGWRAVARAEWRWLVLGGLALVLNWLCLFAAYRHASISVATVVYHTQPFMLLALAAVTTGEAMQRSRLPWLVLAFAGVALTAELHRADAIAGAASGALLACAAAFLYAVATLATRRLPQVPPGQIAAVQMFVGVVVLAPLAWPDLGPLSARGLTAVTTLGLVHTAFMYTLMYAAFQRLPAQTIAALSFLYPLVALLVDLLVYDVRPSAAQIAGMAAIALAIVADQRGWRLRWPRRAAVAGLRE